MMKAAFLKFHRVPLLYLFIHLAACHSSPSSEKISGQQTTDTVNQHQGWEVIGFGGGGNTYCPTVSPHNPYLMMLSCDMTGSYRTNDGGRSWNRFNIMGPVKSFVYDPIDSNTVYALSKGLFRSTDKGSTWKIVYPSPEDIEKVVSKGDEAEETIVTNDHIIKHISALAIDPSDAATLYAVLSEDKAAYFCISRDRGAHWSKEKSIGNGAKNIYVLPASPANDRTILIAGINTIEVRKEGVWKTNNGPAGVKYISQFDGGYDSIGKKFILYAMSDKSGHNNLRGVFYSDNEGQTWENREAGVIKLGVGTQQSPEWRCIGVSAFHPETIYLSYSKLLVGKDTFSMGIAKSTNYGKTWHFSWKDLLTKKRNISDPHYKVGWIDERFDPMWGENPFCFGVSPRNPDICYTTDYGRVVRTDDGGTGWKQCYTKSNDNGAWSTTGLDITTGYGIVMDPFDSTHLFLPTTDVGLMESTDGGNSWKSATKNNGVPEQWVNTTYCLNFDPAIKGKGWAAMSYVHDLPRTKMFRESGILGYDGGILMTSDAGKSWKPVSKTIGPGAVTDLLVDPSSPKNKRTLYACVFGKGIYKSVDDGFTWIKKNNGLEGTEPFVWRIIKRSGNNTLFVVVSRRSTDGSSGNSGDGTVYRSTDGAETWKRIKLPDGVNGPTSIVCDPDDTGRLVLSAWGKVQKASLSSDTAGGIFLSENDGVTWTCVLPTDQHVRDITIDNRNKVWYACGFNSAAYRSADGGKNWSRIKGYDFKWGQRVDPDPQDMGKVYISTFGGGVWHGPATGDPDAHEHLFSPPYHP